MAWKRQSTSKSIDVDVDLDDFSETELLQALIDSRWISEQEAEAIKVRAATQEKTTVISTDADELMEAIAYLRRGNRQEALIHLERFLGRDWIGALQ